MGAILALGMMLVNPTVIHSGQSGQPVEVNHNGVENRQNGSTIHSDDIGTARISIDTTKYKVLVSDLAGQVEKCKNNKEIKSVLTNFSKEHGKDVAYVYYSDTASKFICVPEVELPADYDATIRPWYKKAYENKGCELEPYADAVSGKIIQTCSRAVLKSGKIIGVVSVDFYIND